MIELEDIRKIRGKAMFFEISKKLGNDIKSLLAGVFSEDEFEKGIEAFEKLINIENEKSNFNVKFGEYLNNTNLMSYDTLDIDYLCIIEGFLRKILHLKGVDTEDSNGLQSYYKRIGFYRWLDADDVKEARRRDVANASNAENTPGMGGFSLVEADAFAYRGCYHLIDKYIVTYQTRNRIKHDEALILKTSSVVNIVESLFSVYFDQCIRNYDLICEKYEDELLAKRIDFVSYAKEKIEQMSAFNKGFMQLLWHDENNKQFSYDYNSCVKFVGEAGMGKTTQMQKMYYEILLQVRNRERRVLPIWIDLSEMSELKDFSLEDKIKEKLNEYGNDYELLLNKNVIVLFLDGYNEVLAKDTQEVVKRKLAGDIDDIHKEHKDTIIVMSDRSNNSRPRCLTKDVRVFTFNGLTKNELREYARLKAGENSAKVLDYVNSPLSLWIGNTMISPAKANSLIELLLEDIKPLDEDDFYDKFFDFIMEREEYEKKETRIEDLKYLLYLLAHELQHPLDEMNQKEIIRLWLNEGQVGGLSEAERLFKLAAEIPVLVTGNSEGTYRFAYPQYYHKMYEGL